MIEGVFVKGNLVVVIDKQTYSFIHWNISTFGVTGLPWGTLKPREHFGEFALTEIQIETPEKLRIKTSSQILTESTAQSSFMVIKFLLEPKDKDKLTAFIEKHGHTPPEYNRKYPRIPSTHLIQTFPLHALAKLTKEKNGAPQEFSLILNVDNISPNGLLVSSESSLAGEITPGDLLKITLDPRGWFPFQVTVAGTVSRIMEDINAESKNVSRRFGIKLVKIEDVDQSTFLSLLKTILDQIKGESSS